MTEYEEKVLTDFRSFLAEIVGRYEYHKGIDHVKIANEFRNIADVRAKTICDIEKSVWVTANFQIAIGEYQNYLLTKLKFQVP